MEQATTGADGSFQIIARRLHLYIATDKMMSQKLIKAHTKKIELDEPDDVRFWIQHYGCTEDQLRIAVEAVGDLAQDVREFIAKQAKEALKGKSVN